MKKKFAIALLAILAVSSLSLTAGAYAKSFMSWNNQKSNRGSLQQSYVRMYGNVTEWLTTPKVTPVMGTIEAQSRTTVGNDALMRQGFSATAIWTNNTVQPLAPIRARENFTYSFYTARLVQGNYSALDPTAAISFFMNGTWNVWSVTINFTIITGSNGKIQSMTYTQTLVSLAQDAVGNLTVASGWSTFTLAINHVDTLNGKVISEVTTSRVFNPFTSDSDSSSTTVTPADLNSIVNAYGSTPGYGNYNLRMDPCLDFKIDICDVSTAAANLNTS